MSSSSSVSSARGLSPSGVCSPVLGSDPPTPATEPEDIPELEEHQGHHRQEHLAHEPEEDHDPYVLVTGGLGFIGSHTAVELLRAGCNVLIVDNLSNSFRDVFNRIVLAARLHGTDTTANPTGLGLPKAKAKAQLSCIDYRDTTAMGKLLTTYRNITGVIHFAAWKDVADSIQRPLRYYRNNVQGLIDFLFLLSDHNIKNLIFSSSANVYGSRTEHVPRLREEHCVHEPESYFPTPDDPAIIAQQGCTGITNPYGRSKFFAEAILSDLARADSSWSIVALRYFNPIGCDPSGLLGEDPRQTPSNLLPVAVRVLTGADPELCIYGTDWDTPDGTPIRDFIHVSDLARGHLAALTATREGKIPAPFRTFNLGTGGGHSVLEVVRALESVAQREIPVRAVGRRPGDVGCCVAVPDRAGVELGWKTERSLRDACEDLWNHLRREGLS